MIVRAKVNRRFWAHLEFDLRAGRHLSWTLSRLFRRISRELSRVRIEAYSKGFHEGAEFMRQKLSGKYGV